MKYFGNSKKNPLAIKIPGKGKRVRTSLKLRHCKIRWLEVFWGFDPAKVGKRICDEGDGEDERDSSMCAADDGKCRCRV